MPVFPALPAVKPFRINGRLLVSYLDTVEVAGSNPVVPTIFFNDLDASPSSRFVAFLSQTPKPPHERAMKLLFPRPKRETAPAEMLCRFALPQLCEIPRGWFVPPLAASAPFLALGCRSTRREWS